MSWFRAWRSSQGAQQFTVVSLWCALLEILAMQQLTGDLRLGAVLGLGVDLIHASHVAQRRTTRTRSAAAGCWTGSALGFNLGEFGLEIATIFLHHGHSFSRQIRRGCQALRG